MSAYQETLQKIFRPTKCTAASTFTVFNTDDLTEAAKLTKVYYDKANSSSLQAALDQAVEDCKTKDVELVHYSIMTFISHYPEARKQGLRVPSLAARHPNLFAQCGTATGDEKLLDYWREDPNMNEHHEHWHILYANVPMPNPDPTKSNETYMKDRFGELFVYMHRQMNARYIAERLSVGLNVTKPLEDFNEVIPEGYTPSKHLKTQTTDGSAGKDYAARPVGKTMSMGDNTSPGSDFTVAKVTKVRELIKKSIETASPHSSGYFLDENGKQIEPIVADKLGLAIESGLKGKFDNLSMYTPFHTSGHVILGTTSNGVMGDVRVACRDPIFWRWHRHVDQIYKRYQEKLGPNKFDDCPPVKISSADISLAFKEDIGKDIKELKQLVDPTQDETVMKWGQTNFGAHSTTELHTKMAKRMFTYAEDDQSSQEIQFIFPKEWYYFFRVENTSNQNITVTFRVFIAPEQRCNEFNDWIEMDKFKQALPAKSKIVVARDCDRSSVVRQPPQKTINTLDDTDIARQDASKYNKRAQEVSADRLDENYCDCGWPFPLLLPRGTREGMKFKLFVFISNWELDKIPEQDTRCGSLSFCGARNLKDKYPDLRPMGYPFDRPFKD
ncbi:23728_t:CDS:2, partial [Cetraspora pellucida]